LHFGHLVKNDSFLIRVDAGSGTGLGHLHRCLALSEALHQRGARVIFLLSASEEDVERIKRSNFHCDSMGNLERGGVQDYERTESSARNYGCWTIIVDSYAVENGFVEKLRNGGFRVVVINDDTHGPSSAHVLINGGAHAQQLPYEPAEGDTQFLLGTRYALLRQQFWNVSAKEISPAVNNVLLCVGGDDPLGVMPQLVRQLDTTINKKCIFNVVIGPYFSNYEEIQQIVLPTSRKLSFFNEPEDLFDLMMANDVAVTAGGQTAYELAATGTPGLAVALFDNQHPGARALADAGTLLFSGFAESGRLPSDLSKMFGLLVSDASLRQRLSRTAQSTIDGMGARRVAEVLTV
jgi:UDP-2,4-diacetamido-2,4,6-trideoxy-beta-L-altropyranose hydrolase